MPSELRIADGKSQMDTESRESIAICDPAICDRRFTMRREWLVWSSAALGYFVMVCLATWPVVTRFGSEIPGELTDPLEHLWIMRWLRSCLIEGRNPLFCPSIQAPVGVPLGYFPTLHLQTALYIALRLMTGNDAAIFGVIWFVGFVATGLASFGLARWAIPGCGSGVAWVAGLGMMLCGPMLMHAHGHLETMQMGVVPPFLIAWIRFNEAPAWRRLGWAAAAYLLVVAAAPYFAVLAIFPAAWYSVWSVRWRQVKQRAIWVSGFAAIVLPGVALLFGAQIWAWAHGFPMTRSKRLFDHFGAPPWSGFVPTSRHILGEKLAPRFFESVGFGDRITEVSSYLGVVAVGLLTYAAMKRVDFPRRGFWWSVLVLMIVLSWGTRQNLFGESVSLPAGWIYDVFPPFHLIRVPARFNLFAAAVAVVPVAAGLRELVGNRRWLVVRVGLLVSLAGLTLVDLAMVPFPTAVIPDPPSFHADLKRDKPNATILEAPLFDSTKGQTYSSLWGYWQQVTGLNTSGGYPGLTNTRFDAEIARGSVFSAARLDNGTHSGDYWRDGVLDDHDRAWLELTAHGFDYAVLHHDPLSGFDDGGRVSHLRDKLAEGIIRSTAEASVCALDRLSPPTHLTWLTDQGWRPVPAPRRGSDPRFAALRDARIVLYQPTSGSVALALNEAEAFVRPRVVRVVEGANELARFSVRPGQPETLQSPPISLSPGLHTWTLRSDGDDRPTRSADRLDDAATPYSFRLSGVRLIAGEPE